MKNRVFILFFTLIFCLAVQAQAASIANPVTPAATTTDSTEAIPLEVRKEKAYTELSALTDRLSDIAVRLQNALGQLSDKHVDMSSVTPLVEAAQLNLTSAADHLIALAPTAADVALTSPTDTAPQTLAAPAKKITPGASNDEDVKAAVTTVETDLKNARQNLIDSLIKLKAVLIAAQTATP